MSDYIPFDIQAKIMKNLPSKSLIQFRTVSKAWKSLIDSFEFIADHHRHTHQRHNYLLVRDSEHNYFSVVDDNTFPRHKIPLTLPMSAGLRNKPRILGSSQGLFCLYGNLVGRRGYSGTDSAAIWNPAIRKLVDIGQLPHARNMIDTVGFGVCPHSFDPKILTIYFPWGLTDNTGTWRVEVFRLSLGAWTSLSTNLPPEIILTGNQVAIHRFIYWPASHVSVKLIEFDVIMSFDLTSEEFTEIHLPDVLTLNPTIGIDIYKLKESLVVLQDHYERTEYDVWIMENGVQQSFKKIYTIKYYISDVITSVLEFRNSGEPIVLISDNFQPPEEDDDYLPDPNHLYEYKPNSRHFRYIGISSKESSFLVRSYEETLLLLDH